ncbi:predicted protein [Sclerotinia sclerotiorum 1980 UF-70]|uniref:Uncharacterized protein n=1 Tax=Sclerotinia sclerotiorum (strain ATCC 18683 / 1980 / Ss-1) TaxID=665079 RepID=A7EGA7_SCLS1|nr:predicted protein [Sclerotinia sclerotiorum 1980 UF-70]EDO01873.1 predicted protein [Sclerotinia sclerotiorum 1980 UF-70]
MDRMDLERRLRIPPTSDEKSLIGVVNVNVDGYGCGCTEHFLMVMFSIRIRGMERLLALSPIIPNRGKVRMLLLLLSEGMEGTRFQNGTIFVSIDGSAPVRKVAFSWFSLVPDPFYVFPPSGAYLSFPYIDPGPLES